MTGMELKMKILLYVGMIVALGTGPVMARQSEQIVLLNAYLRFNLAQQVNAQALLIAENLSEEDAKAVRDVADEWVDDEADAVRKMIEERMGDRARDRFEHFVSAYTAAENAGDAAYLSQLAASAGAGSVEDYSALRRWVLDGGLAQQLAAATRLLSEMETWADVRTKQPDTPGLDIWLARDVGKPAAPVAPRRPVNPLAAAEAPSAAWNDEAQPAGSALDAFAQRRRDRREQALQSAQAGMQQLAMERQSAEQEYAARRMAEAQADADAMRAQAQRQAAAESEAMAQRENSFGSRIKRVVGATVSASVGAFTGGIGAEAGRRAAEELFR